MLFCVLETEEEEEEPYEVFISLILVCMSVQILGFPGVVPLMPLYWMF